MFYSIVSIWDDVVLTARKGWRQPLLFGGKNAKNASFCLWSTHYKSVYTKKRISLSESLEFMSALFTRRKKINPQQWQNINAEWPRKLGRSRPSADPHTIPHKLTLSPNSKIQLRYTLDKLWYWFLGRVGNWPNYHRPGKAPKRGKNVNCTPLATEAFPGEITSSQLITCL